MKCDKCGAEIPNGSMECLNCSEKVKNSGENKLNTDTASVYPQTLPQRPRTAYSEREPEKEQNPRKRKKNVKMARIIIFSLVIVGIICGAIIIGYNIIKNGREDPLDEPPVSNNPVNPDEDVDGDNTQDGDDVSGLPKEPEVFDISGVWILDSDTSLMGNTIWMFNSDGTLKIYYFGTGIPENPYDEWPDLYTYDSESSVLTLAGEAIDIVWKSETSFTMSSVNLGSCNVKKTDEAHIPTGAVDINDAAAEDDNTDSDDTPADVIKTSDYFFADSNKRYLTKEECKAYTADELMLARNEIYARRGRLFDMAQIQDYFNTKDWYKGTIKPADFDYDILNAYEVYNVNLILSVEQELKKN